MSRDKLRQLKRSTHKMDFHPSTQMVHTLLDHGLEALDEIDGGKSIQELRAELKERERQIGLALKDLDQALVLAKTFSTNGTEREREIGRARYILDMIQQMLKAKGPHWHREWSWYAARVLEEFDD